MTAQVDCNRINEAAEEEAILTFDVSDDALERAGGTGGQIVTLAYCTHVWYYCDLPQ
jgi:hypothetical protein